MGRGLGTSTAQLRSSRTYTTVRRTRKSAQTIAMAALMVIPAMARGEDAAAKPAAGSQAPAAPAPKSIYDRIWGFAKVYNNSDNPWFQELSIVGREQVDAYHFDADQGNADNFVNRRTRIGLKSRMFKTVTVHTEVDLDLEGGEVYSKLTDAYVKWSPDKRLNLTAGKHGAKFTLDGSTSSTSLITIDRSNVANNFWYPDEYVPGVTVNGDVGKWMYNAGIFTAGDQNSEFGDFSGDRFMLLSSGYDLASLLGTDKALVRLDYVYQNPDPHNDFARPNEHVGSLNFQLEKGRWELATDLDASKGYGSQGDMVGGQVMPSVRFFDTWQLVVRYTGISGDDNTIRLVRYENRIVSGRGDEYHEFYIGLNKYFYGHKLKWQTGLQYAEMHDDPHDGGRYQGWGVTTGLRVSW